LAHFVIPNVYYKKCACQAEKGTRVRPCSQGAAGNDINFDLEACEDLVNPEEVRGNICIVARGSCFFSTKTLVGRCRLTPG